MVSCGNFQTLQLFSNKKGQEKREYTAKKKEKHKIKERIWRWLPEEEEECLGSYWLDSVERDERKTKGKNEEWWEGSRLIYN